MGIKDIQMKIVSTWIFICFVVSLQGQNIITGAERLDQYLPLLKGKRVGVVANQSSMIGNDHLVDVLIASEVNVLRVFSPEHGFRGQGAAGEEISSSVDNKTGLPIISLYGTNKKPTDEQLNLLDIVVFDIQDVGVRFYTYISTMSYVMEACAQKGIPVMVLDRPNPNGDYVDGPVLKAEFKSFVGLHPVPVVYGMTMGEYARMVNGEGWLKGAIRCDLLVIPLKNYSHSKTYSLPIKPSPNLPNDDAIRLYPSLCFFEGGPVSVGRGTDLPFQQFGAPWFKESNYYFIPKSVSAAPNPKFENDTCYGIDARDFLHGYISTSKEIYIWWLVEMYRLAPDKENFFLPIFNKLAGSDELQNQLKAGKNADEIRATWQSDLQQFKGVREEYMLYLN